jgi:hypothetical protein
MMRGAVATLVLLAMPAEVAAQRSATRMEAPSRSEVGRAMRLAQAGVRHCAPSMGGVVSVFVTFESSGRVRTAAFGLFSEREQRRTAMHFSAEDESVPPINARPGFVNSNVARCILAEVAKARVPAFTWPQFVVQYPFVM